MTRIQELTCDPVIRNAIERNLTCYAEEMHLYCACDILDIKGMRWRRIWCLQEALLEVGCTLRPCRFVWLDKLPWRKTADQEHQRLIDGTWRSGLYHEVVDPQEVPPERIAGITLDQVREWGS